MRATITLVTVLVAGTLSACGSGSGLTINLYVSPENNLQHVVDTCKEAAGGRYRIEYHKLPRSADGRREQLVRRLAAEDASPDVLGLDVTWVPEFAEAGTGAPYEGLVVFYNTLVASAGGLLKTLTTAGITDPSLGNTKEDEVRQAFQRGQGALELNWPYVYASYAKEKPQDLGHVRWARYPSVVPGRASRVTIGGFNLAISTYSPHKAKAFEAALCLRGPASQKYQAIEDGLAPTTRSVYDDPTPLDPADPGSTMAAKFPMKPDILAALSDAAVRPLTPAYQNLSTVISEVLSPPSGIDPQATAAELRERLTDALASRDIIP
jgi:ABC-type glycerol-3-phosphate transport system substrate-binding protein